MILDKRIVEPLELIANGKFGLTVSAQVVIGNTLHLVEYNNITEVHWRYGSGVSVAIESDIHKTGYTHPIENVVRLEVQIATQFKPTI